MSDCAHTSFTAHVEVVRVTKEEGGPVIGYDTTVTVNCAECGKPFRWLGLQAGLSPAGPMVSVDGLELRAPIVPQDEDMELTRAGFRINMRGVH